MSVIQSFLIALVRETMAASWADPKTIYRQAGILSEDTCVCGLPPSNKVSVVNLAHEPTD